MAGGGEGQGTIGALPFSFPRGGASFITFFFSSPKSLAITYINYLGEQNDLVSWSPCARSLCSEMTDGSSHAHGLEACQQSKSGSSRISSGTKICLIVGMAASVRIRRDHTSSDCSVLSPFLCHFPFITYVGHSSLLINKETNSERLSDFWR